MNSIEWLTRLVAFDTTSRNSNLQLIACLEDYFAQQQIATRITRDPDEQKANLFATLSAQDGSMEGGIIFSGHTDVVPVDGQTWNTHPFEATVMQDKMYGRGTCDMKGFIAVLLALLPEFKQLRLKHPLHFAFSYDEEVGCRGAPYLITDLLREGIRPAACIVGEPTEMHPVVGHKGINVFRCRVQGLAAHSSLTPQACNAIEYAAELICFIRKLATHFREQGPFDDAYDVPFTSVSTNMIQGGIAHNTIPSSCEFIFEFRNLPDVKPQQVIDVVEQYIEQELVPMMRNEHASAAIEIDNIAAVPSFTSSADAAINHLVRTMTGEEKIRKVAYATEAGLFQQAHIPTIVCGPGSIEQAHRANEFVTLAQLKKCEEFLRRVVGQML